MRQQFVDVILRYFRNSWHRPTDINDFRDGKAHALVARDSTGFFVSDTQTRNRWAIDNVVSRAFECRGALPARIYPK